MNQSNSPSTKRKRAENDAFVIPITRGDPWFDDGNIILQAEQTQFRVYRGLLASSSTIFSDMLSVPQPNTPDQLVEGCPVVELPDLARDWEHVLRALFKRSYCHVTAKSVSVAVVSAFLRLGKKYDFEKLVANALERLHLQFPSSLPLSKSHDDQSISISSLADSFDIVNLAREANLHSVLPMALYKCISHKDMFRYLLIGMPREDASISLLSPADQQRCLIGWRSLVYLRTQTTFYWLQEDYKHCGNAGENITCAMEKRVIEKTMHPVLQDPSDIFDEWDSEWGRRLCDTCARKAKDHHERGRLVAWRNLPRHCDLIEWSEINDP